MLRLLQSVKMRKWHLSIKLHWPHDRFALGTEYIGPDETFNGFTYIFYLFIITLELDIEKN